MSVINSFGAITTWAPLALAPAARREEMFLTLTSVEIARLQRFGVVRRYADGEALVESGKPRAGMFVLLSGRLAVTARDGLGGVSPIVELGPGQFLAELGSLANTSIALVDGRAMGSVDALLILPERLRGLLVAEADLGERVMHALMLRRDSLIEAGVGALLVGPPTSMDTARLERFLTRNGYPHRLLDPDTEPLARTIIAGQMPAASELPLVLCPDGSLLLNPRDNELARVLGIDGDVSTQTADDVLYDVAVVGSGPAGMATAVYAASEGLSVLVLDARAYGGQAGASARIENYFGFPTGISGQELTGRAYAQARKFGAEFMIPVEVRSLECERADNCFGLLTDGGARFRARSAVVATGARYRRPSIENLATFEGRGVWYWASPLEARLCHSQEVIVVGGGNSAGQAAVFLAGHAGKVRMMIRGPRLAATMSRYLADRIAAIANIEVETDTQVVALHGTPEIGLEEVRWSSHRTGREARAPIRHVFFFVGADPATRWLADCGIDLDRNGFVITGRGSSPLVSNVPGVFAIGDVRVGSVKRVGSAIGEGAQVVAALHDFLADSSTPTVFS